MPGLKEYERKRHFEITPEPRGAVAKKDEKLFVVQKHDATRLHYDLRLEVNGVMKSWAVPKGPSLNPGDKRLAIQVEDHPLEYRKFEGVIPPGQYGAGEVIIWDEGTFEPEGNDSAARQLERGELKFRLHGKKLRGSFVIVKLKRSAKKNEWLLIKHRDADADPNWNAGAHDESVVSGRTLADIKQGKQPRKKANVDASKLKGAQRSAIPSNLSPTLARLAEEAFSDPHWLFEIKWDGVRAISYIEGEKVRIFSRTGRDISKEFPEFAELDRDFDAKQAIVDGEIVTLDAHGRSDFQKLQNRLGVSNPPEKLRQAVPAIYYVFDLLYCDGYDIRKSPLLERKELLERILRPGARVRYSTHEIGKGQELSAAAREQGLEGIVGKQIDSPYTGNRTPFWLKFKNVKELDAVIAGWTAPRRTRQYFGVLVLGLYDEKKELQFIGSAGTGFEQKTQKQILDKLSEIRTNKSPFRQTPKLREHVEWVRPELAARIKYGNFTEDKHLRAPVFLSLRKDISAKDCTFAAAQPGALPAEAAKHVDTSGIGASPAKISAYTAPEPRTHGGTPAKSAAVAAKAKGAGNKLAARAPSASFPLHATPARSRPKSRASARAIPRSGSKASPTRPAADSANVWEQLAEGAAETINAEIDGRTLHFTHLNKIYFPESGIKKRELLAYYFQIADYILPFLKDRPLVLRRYPNGIEGESFFQKEAPQGVPDWVARATVYSDERGGEMNYVMANDRASLLYLTNLGCIDHNPWSSRAQSQESPDFVFLDLDPTEGTPFSTVLRVARAIYELLHSARVECFLKTSGATGFHIYVPLEPRYTYEQTKTFAQIVGELVSAELPNDTTLERMVKKRPRGRVLIDALQNAHGKPLASVYSARAFPGAPVSTPVSPKELSGEIAPEKWNIGAMPARVREMGDLWKDFWKKRQSLNGALEKLNDAVSRRSTKRR